MLIYLFIYLFNGAISSSGYVALTTTDEVGGHVGGSGRGLI